MNKLTAHRYGDMRSGKRRICTGCDKEKPVESFLEGGNYDNPVCCGCRWVAPVYTPKNNERGKFMRLYRKHGLPIPEVDK